MKSITNKKVSIVIKSFDDASQKIVDEIREFNYSKLIFECCNKAADPKSGFSYQDIKSIDKIKKAIDAEKDGVITFEDADYEFVKSKVINERWLISDMQFVEFVDYIKGIE